MAVNYNPALGQTLSNYVDGLDNTGIAALRQIMSGQGPTDLSTQALLNVLRLGATAYGQTPDYDMSGFINSYVTPYANSNNRDVYNGITNFYAALAEAAMKAGAQNNQINSWANNWADLAAQRANIANAGGHIGQISNMLGTLNDLADRFNIGSVPGLKSSWDKVQNWLNPKIGKMSVDLWEPAANLFNSINANQPEYAGTPTNFSMLNPNSLPAYALSVLQNINSNYKSRYDKNTNNKFIQSAGNAYDSAYQSGKRWNSTSKPTPITIDDPNDVAMTQANTLEQLLGLRKSYKSQNAWIAALNKNKAQLRNNPAIGAVGLRKAYSLGGMDY